MTVAELTSSTAAAASSSASVISTSIATPTSEPPSLGLSNANQLPQSVVSTPTSHTSSSSSTISETTEIIEIVDIVTVDEEIHLNAEAIKEDFERRLNDTPVNTIVNSLHDDGVLIEETDSVFKFPADPLAAPVSTVGDESQLPSTDAVMDMTYVEKPDNIDLAAGNDVVASDAVTAEESTSDNGNPLLKCPFDTSLQIVVQPETLNSPREDPYPIDILTQEVVELEEVERDESTGTDTDPKPENPPATIEILTQDVAIANSSDERESDVPPEPVGIRSEETDLGEGAHKINDETSADIVQETIPEETENEQVEEPPEDISQLPVIEEEQEETVLIPKVPAPVVETINSPTYCNPFDLDTPIEVVKTSLSVEDVDDPSLPTCCNNEKYPRTLRKQRASSATYIDDAQNQDEMDETLITGETQVRKCVPISEDQSNGRFPDKLIEITRGKGAQLKDEELTGGVYKNKVGFRTSRPLHWAMALEELLPDSRWDYSVESSMFTQCLIKLTNNSGMITIEIKLTNGIVFIYGSQYEMWSESFFDVWHSLAVDGVKKSLNTTLTTSEKDTHEATETISTADLKQDVERLWSDHSSLKNAIVTIDMTMKNLSNDIQDMLSAINDLKSSQESLSESNCAKTEEKLQTFIKLVSDECIGNVSKCKVEMRNEIEKNKALVLKQESRFQSVTDQLKNQMTTQPQSDAPSIKWTHLENVRQSCSSSHENLESSIQLVNENVESLLSKFNHNAQGSTEEHLTRLEQKCINQQKQIDDLVQALNLITNSSSTSPLSNTTVTSPKEGAPLLRAPNAHQQGESSLLDKNTDLTLSADHLSLIFPYF